jgi:ABC-type branched-chain amino acid transport systems, periplasmic component
MPNDQNKRYVADFKKKHGVYPSYYGAQSYDAIMLIASAAEALKGDLSNKDKVRAEMKKANFKSLRGDFKYNTNNFPIQNFYIQEAVKDPQGMMTVKTIATAVKEPRILLREVPDEVTAARSRAAVIPSRADQIRAEARDL